MSITLTSLTDIRTHGFDALIDVRSPAEFAEDHIAGAINLPVLSDPERARVGTIYVQESAFLARKIGAALVTRNVAHHLETALADHEGGWHPLLYCWRGGQRSGTFATILREIGWRAETIEGGYRSYRRLVVKALYDSLWPGRMVLLDGNTGTAKTEILARLAARGVQVLDLEGLARHRGSVLGGMAEAQPSQKAFESVIAMVLARLDPARPLVVEAESSKVGARLVPPALWKAMCAAPRIELTVPTGARAAYLARAYRDILSDLPRLSVALDKLVRFHGHERVRQWRDMARAGHHAALSEALIREHYDPTYDRARARQGRQTMARLNADDLDTTGLDALSEQVASVVMSA